MTTVNLTAPFYQTLADAVTCAILVLDRHHAIIYANEAAAKLFANHSSQLIGETIHPLLPDNFLEQLRANDFPTGLQPFIQRDTRIDDPLGQSFVADISVSEWTVGHHGDVADILVEIQPLDRLSIIARNAQLVYQQSAIKQLSRNLAHEIKNPLGGILGAAQLLARQLPEDDRELTDIISREVSRLQRLVDDMLGPNQPMNRQPMNIHRLLDELVTLTHSECPSVLIQRNYDPSIPEIEADYDRLNAAFINLLKNAQEASLAHNDTPTIRLITRIERQFTLHQRRHKMVLRVSIADNGAGIPAEIRQQIFLPTITNKANGNGLGLAIAQNIVHQHGGIVDLDQEASEAGETIFSVYLPLQAADPMTSQATTTA